MLITVSLVRCAEISGGAVELHWELRCNSELCCPASVAANDVTAGNTENCKTLAQRMTCEEAGIATIEFNLDCISSSCQESYLFLCSDSRGQVDFEIPEETYEIGVTAIPQASLSQPDSSIATSNFSFVSPPLIEREITDGNLSDLGVLAILIESQ